MSSDASLTIRFQEKLPKGFGYPVSAEVLSPSLIGVAPFEELTVGFYRHPMFLPSAATAALRASGKVPILKASHICLRQEASGLHPSLVEGWSNETWEISVWGMPVNLVPRCLALLQGQGLTRLRAWLDKPAKATKGPSRRSLELCLVREDQSLRAEESP